MVSRENPGCQSAKWLTFARVAPTLILLFACVFYGADFLAGLRSDRFRFYFAWERNIPFLPAAFVIYYSVFLLPLLVPLYLEHPKELRVWGWKMALAILIAGALFVLLPFESGYPEHHVLPPLLYEANRVLTGTYNLVPSLHVALTLICALEMWPRLNLRLQLWLSAWVGALIASTFFTHQHHLLDVIAGGLLAVSLQSLRTRQLG